MRDLWLCFIPIIHYVYCWQNLTLTMQFSYFHECKFFLFHILVASYLSQTVSQNLSKRGQNIREFNEQKFCFFALITVLRTLRIYCIDFGDLAYFVNMTFSRLEIIKITYWIIETFIATTKLPRKEKALSQNWKTCSERNSFLARLNSRASTVFPVAIPVLPLQPWNQN